MKATADIVMEELVRITGTDQIRGHLDLALFDEGILDSLGLIELIVAVEENFHIGITPAQVDREAWSTPRKIIAEVESRMRSLS